MTPFFSSFTTVIKDVVKKTCTTFSSVNSPSRQVECAKLVSGSDIFCTRSFADFWGTHPFVRSFVLVFVRACDRSVVYSFIFMGDLTKVMLCYTLARVGVKLIQKRKTIE